VASWPRLLYELDEPALTRAGRDQRYPKWATLCMLRLLGHPVLNGGCIPPSQGLGVVRIVAHRLCMAAKVDRLLLRSDGGIESSRYYRGGTTFDLDALLPRAAHLFDLGRAVIVMEPTNRFTNRLSAPHIGIPGALSSRCSAPASTSATSPVAVLHRSFVSQQSRSVGATTRNRGGATFGPQS